MRKERKSERDERMYALLEWGEFKLVYLSR